MAGRKRSAPEDTASTPRTTRSRARGGAASASRRTNESHAAVPDIYRDMLAEARAEIVAQRAETVARPLKRPRPRESRISQVSASKEPSLPETRTSNQKASRQRADDAADGENFQSEDVVLPTPTVQTIVRETDDEDDDEIDFEDVVIEPAASAAATTGAESEGLNLDLAAHMPSKAPGRADRRKAINREEKERRVQVHKIHLLCLLSHVEMRNRWCNDPKVQDVLRPLLPQKTVSALIPRATLNQFGRSESFKKGVQEAKDMFKMKFAITERGLRRALWAEDEEQLHNYQLPDDIETTLDKTDFLEAAKKLRGSRDVGAQLFCALLRSVGVEARLVCSLQPLPFVAGAPTMPKQKRNTQEKEPKMSRAEQYLAAVAKHETKFPEFQAGATTASPRQRLGHPHAAAYHVPQLNTPPPPSTAVPKPRKPITGESPFPVYWVEVLDVARQEWQPVDPLVTGTQWKPRALEPPASDRYNSLSYAIAFEADGSAHDVTRRYAKAYNSRTRRTRIDNPTLTLPSTSSGTTVSSGARWYRRVLSRYARSPLHPHYAVLDQIEANQLAKIEASEPMPRNVADFKDHPIYALERHLRRHEVLVPGAQAIGTVSAGTGPNKGVERIYRRSDVRIARTKEKWWRLGRVVRGGEVAVKILPKPKRRKGRGGGDWNEGEDSDKDYDDDDDDPDRVGLLGDDAPSNAPLYTLAQTDPYVAPPVGPDGRVPRNRFGNVDLYVPSMLPPGGAHVAHERAAQAACILGVDYAPALTGFEFRGRQGTAVLRGVVVAEAAAEAVWAVIEGLEEMEAEEEAERRSRRALRMWSRFLKALRIRERIWAGVDEEGEEEEEEEEEEEGKKDKGKGREVVDEEEEASMENVESEDNGRGGGFFVPDEDEDDGGGGGFIVE